MGCDFFVLLVFYLKHSFNPRTHVGCDIVFLTFRRLENVFQSTHPRGVRRTLLLCKQSEIYVSIHAPTWGATAVFKSFPLKNGVSIHAPTWGATHCIHPKNTLHRFQSTHPRGVRLIFSKYLNIILQKYINCEQHANF